MDETTKLVKAQEEPLIPAAERHQVYLAKGHPYSRANIVSKAFFFWVYTLMKFGSKKPLEQTDLWDLRKRDCSETQHAKLRRNWIPCRDNPKKKYPLLSAITKTYAWTLGYALTCNALNALLGFSGPIAIKIIGDLIEHKSGNTSEGIIWVGILFVCKLFQSIFGHQANFTQAILGINISNGVSTQIYEKSLLLTPAAQTTYSHGEIVNLIQVDVGKIQMFFLNFSYLVIALVQCTVGMYLLFDFLGISFVGGLGVIVIMTIVNMVIGVCFGKLQKALMKERDKRMQASTELFSAIKIIKLFSWEDKFIDKVEGYRTAELKVLRTLFYYAVFSIFFLYMTPMMISTSTFALYTLVEKENLNAATIFAAIALFNIMQEPIRSLPNVMMSIIQNMVSLRRIENFLKCEEIPAENVSRMGMASNSIEIENGFFSWGVPPKNENEVDSSPKGPAKRRSTAGSVFHPKRGMSKTTDIGHVKPQGNTESDEERKEGEDDQLLPAGEEGEVLADIAPAVLHDINLKIKKGEFLAIVGEVGSGKSSLMSAIIGDLKIVPSPFSQAGSMISTQVRVDGKISYVSQKAWIQNDTIKNNVLFGKSFDSGRYEQALKYSCLGPDLEILPNGDATQIGERGINLSGGQKTRVALARAIYADSQIVLLDDTLSAVDNHVGRRIFNDCFLEHFEDKTRLLITHGVQYLPTTDRIIVMDGGRIVQEGTYEELESQDGYFKDLLGVHFRFTNNKDDSENEEGVEKDGEDIINENPPLKLKKLGSSMAENDEHNTSFHGTNSEMSILHDDDDEDITEEKTKKDGKQSTKPGAKPKNDLIVEEDREIGQVSFKVYKDHVKYNGGYWVAVFVLFVMAVFMVLKVGSDFWLSYWSQQSDSEQDRHVDHYLFIYAMFALTSAFFVFIRVWTLCISSLRASKKLHKAMLTNLTRAPINLFFDRTPTGRLLNRLSKDLNVVDFSLPFVIGNTIRRGYEVIAIFVVISIPLPYMLVSVPLLGFFAFGINRFYLASNRELTRLESISRSPIVNFFSETLQGLPVIRAYSRQPQFDRVNKDRIDENVKANYTLQSTNQWFGICLEFASNLILVAACLIFVLWRDHFDPAVVSLVLSYGILLQDSIFWFLTSASLLETRMVSVERTHAFTRVESEAPLIIESNRPQSAWPQHGRVEFKNYSVRYRPDTELVLQNLTCTIEGGEKIGIVGRTGAGKSTVTLSLFRIIEPSNGSIIIDGIDITSIGLQDLRRKLSIIPQDPVLFSGTIRMNIDPFNEHSDQEIWNALERSCLKMKVEEWDDQLTHEISEGGENLSVGERQLVCIARAFVKRSKIVVIDEATASIDSATDSQIYETMKASFSECTVMTIAHRIHTVIENDRIMVLDRGELMEFDSPKTLLDDPESMFSQLVNKAH